MTITTQNGISRTTPPTLEQGIETIIAQGQQTNLALQALAQQMQSLTQLLAGQAAAPVSPGGVVSPVTPVQPAPAPEEWQKVVQESKCAEIGVSKTRSLNKWKINFYMYGLTKPASVYGRDGYQGLIRFMAEVWPAISPDHFSEETFNHENKQLRDLDPNRTYIFRHTLDAPFIVEWYDGPPTKMADGKVMSFRYAERVYPCT